MVSTEKFCLRWNDFESNISGAFRELREDKDFFDVTLACDDEQLQAHKVILSACSPFFRTILRRNKHEHPLLYLKGVKYVDLVSVLNFMYHGEVNVAQEELNSFLAVAEDLKVKGLTQGNTETNQKNSVQSNPPKSRNIETPRREETPLSKRAHPIHQVPRASPLTPRTPLTPYPTDDDEIQEVLPVKTEPSLPPVIQTNSSDQDYSMPQVDQIATGVVADPNMEYADEFADYESYEVTEEGFDTSGMNTGTQDCNKGDTESLISSYYFKTTCQETGATIWQCQQCDKTSKWKTSIKNHVESAHLSKMLLFKCTFCPHVNNTSAGLKMHNKRNHT